MIRFPYGLADFNRLITDGYFYVDRTAHIRRLEALGDVLLYVRPRRFGKSLWLHTLACYYDLRLADDFERLFGGLAIGRDPTPLRDRYFVLQWDFSTVAARGSVEEIAASLAAHVRAQVEAFVRDYDGLLPAVEVSDRPETMLTSLLAAIRQTPHRLYLLIDEYDTFVNDVMVSDATVYRALVHRDGPFKQLLKAVKSATAGLGLERIFLTGVSPVALSDMTSGFDIARNVSQHPYLSDLCGFTEPELVEAVAQLSAAAGLPPKKGEKALALMRSWYDGYSFAEGASEQVYSPMDCLYFLRHLQEHGTCPDDLLDHSLSVDQEKFSFLSRLPAAARVVANLLRQDGEITVKRIENRFTLDDLVRRLDEDDSLVASLLYHYGFLTQRGWTAGLEQRLGIPNLGIGKLFADQAAGLLVQAL